MARRLSEEEAMDYVAGIAIGQDFAERDWETNESRWLYGKAYDAPIALGKRVRTNTHRVFCRLDAPLNSRLPSFFLVVAGLYLVRRPSALEKRRRKGHR